MGCEPDVCQLEDLQLLVTVFYQVGNALVADVGAREDQLVKFGQIAAKKMFHTSRSQRIIIKMNLHNIRQILFRQSLHKTIAELTRRK